MVSAVSFSQSLVFLKPSSQVKCCTQSQNKAATSHIQTKKRCLRCNTLYSDQDNSPHACSFHGHTNEHKKDVSFLTSLPGASQRLQIHSADLSNPESFNAAIEGCIGVFHVATPVDFELDEPEEVVTKRSIDGALGILKACLNSKTVKRVVYTSSASAAAFNNKEVLDESCWSDVDSLRADEPEEVVTKRSIDGALGILKACLNSKTVKRVVYTSSASAAAFNNKETLTEKAVLEFGEQNGLDVVTLIPTFVFGPFICPKLPSSVQASLCFAFGGKSAFGFIIQTPMVHVDDVARAHIFLLEHPNPKGSSSKQIEGIKIQDLSSKKLKDAGFVFMYGLEEMLDDAIQCCKQKGLPVR
uniref:Dihydroflavonol-4-reductase n=1 Tax=Cajanus cajan TaxID=3821 RepID=A0A151SBZ0_CAJCA|nr:Dihydroflavonol-4-reductase [Cajanus cajan]